jgi:hypothetical protein
MAAAIDPNLEFLSDPFGKGNAEMEKMFARDLTESDQIRWEEWEKRPLLSRVRERFYHLFSHWL